MRVHGLMLPCACLLLAAGLPCLAADNRFTWDAAVGGGYTGNVFFNDTYQISAYAARVSGGVGLSSVTPTSSLDLGYRTGYLWYDESTVNGVNNMPHALHFDLRQDWTQRLTFQAFARGEYTPEQEGFVDRVEDRFTVYQRAQRLAADSGLDWMFQASQRTDLRFGVRGAMVDYGDPVLGVEAPLADETLYQGTLGIGFTTGPTSRVGVDYGFQRQDYSRDAYEFLQDTDGDGTGDANVAGPAQDGGSDTHTLAVDYSWRISEQSNGAVAVGVYRTQARGESNVNSGSDTDTSVLLRASVNSQLSRTVTAFYGASRDISSYGGFGGTALNESAFAAFRFQTGQMTSLAAQADYTRRKDVGENDRSVSTLGAHLDWRHRLGKWGGYFVGYGYVDQNATGAQEVGDTTSTPGDPTLLYDYRDLQYDIVNMGFFFSKPGGTEGRARWGRER